jgi:enamine deaminase RidA (YjgF/YER057c/UK114 family)
VSARERRHLRTGSRFEAVAGYCRALRVGDRILVSGTVDMDAQGEVAHPDDAYAQTHGALAIALGAVEALGGAREDVIRTRVLLASAAEWEGPVRAHGEVFAGIDPVNTTVYVDRFVLEGALVEVEIEAEVGAAG